MPTEERPPRIGGWEWQKARPHAIAVYNGGYSPSGHRLPIGDKPWTVVGPNQLWATFPTHVEAISFAFKEAATA